MAELVLHCADHLWRDLVSKTPLEMQKMLIGNEDEMIILANEWCKILQEMFEDIRSGHHKCDRQCFIEYLFDRAERFEIDLDASVRLAAKVLAELPREWLDEDLGSDDARREVIGDRILKRNVPDVIAVVRFRSEVAFN